MKILKIIAEKLMGNMGLTPKQTLKAYIRVKRK